MRAPAGIKLQRKQQVLFNMRIIFIGEKRHATHPTVSRFLELGRTQGYTMVLCDNDEFPQLDLEDVDMVCLKSHFDIDGVCSRLDSACPDVRVVNSRESILVCADRFLLYEQLREAGVQMPAYARTVEELKVLNYPVIRKPRLANQHQLKIIEEPPGSPDFGQFYYEDFIPTDGMDYKIYCVGEEAWLIRRESSFQLSQEEKVKEKREELPVPPELGDVAMLIGEMTGLEIFGVDFIKSGDRFYLIDVNPFPGFIGVAKAAEHWWDYLLEKQG
jgi:glutathione synthase/RimK-type ligase-like ATP-grasp enzyme